MSRPFVTRLVPTRMSSRAARERVDDALRRPAPLDDVAVQPADPEVREPPPDLVLDALRAAAEVADPRRAAVRAAGRDRRRPARSDGSGASSRPGGRRAAARTPGQVWTWPQSRHRTTDAVPRRLIVEDRLVAGRRGRGRAIASTSRSDSSPRLPAAQLLAEVDDLDRRPGAGRAVRQDDPPVASLARPPDRSRRPASRCRGRPPRRPARRAAIADVAGLEPRRPVALVRARRAPRRRRSGRRRRAARGPRAASRRRCRRRPPGSAATRRPARRRPSPEWTSATRTSRSARSRSTSGIARAISGTRTSAGRPRSRDATIAST